ncbi:MAG: hypothetical protein WDN08_12955 [Rhizomicrobium sp.]
MVLVGGERGRAKASGTACGRAAPERTGWTASPPWSSRPLLEDAPRRLLVALASSVPVIATAACGLPAQDGLTLVPPGDADALIAALHVL